VGELVVDKTTPWVFFDGVCRGEDSQCGIGGISLSK